MDKSTHQIRCEQWTTIINNCLASGMTRKAWCKENRISEKSFYYWQRILRNEAYIEQKQMKSAIQASEPSVAFVELKPTVTASGISDSFRPDVIIRKQDISLEISNSASPELLKQLGGFFHAQ